MTEKNTKSKENTEQTSPEENQGEVAEEAHFFHPMQLSEGSEETLDEQEIEKSKVEIEQKLQELLKSINEETLQLSEFLMEESKLMKELCISLRHILKRLNVSFNIPPQDMPLPKKVKKVILNEEGHLILVYEKSEVNSAFLAEYPPEIVMAALWIVMPELAKVVMLYRKKISTRVNFFGKVKKELKSVVKAIVGKEDTSDTDSEQMIDAVQESVKPEN
ncbi:hypothetical protein HXY33_07345 [Candidatus Bathyarchaeota archaeon]|nr:hypothetical protein [Candidatus Bathyarchaeota archaeon]